MMRLALLSVAVPLALLVSGGCPLEPPAETPDPARMTPEATAATAAEVGETVGLTARLADGVDTASVTFRWFQTYGRLVEILNSDTANASFVAPSLPAEQTLRFRVDVTASGGTIFDNPPSDTVAVTVALDPDYGLDESVEEESDEDDPYPQVRLVTSMGSITVELDRENAPLTVSNFLRYVDDGFYDGTIFHRVIADFVIQGGGYDEDLELLDTRPPILSEADNGLSNVRGTIGMAYSPDGGPDSGASQFFINVMDNLHLDYDNPNTDAVDDGNKNTVFGEVIYGMDVVDEIAEVETGTQDGMSDVPVENVFLRRVERIESGGDDDGGDGPITNRG